MNHAGHPDSYTAAEYDRDQRREEIQEHRQAQEDALQGELYKEYKTDILKINEATKNVIENDDYEFAAAVIEGDSKRMLDLVTSELWAMSEQDAKEQMS